ncbi:MAG TPA: glycosyltransferase, partial [Tepidisphaeraceae bacterium]|nr:glycosyltransferase [Tepidisphaeraceae bacterium]
MRLLVVIVNFRTAPLVIDCLRSLDQPMRELPGAKVVITDNASGDDSVRLISQAIADSGWSEWAQIIPLETNGGFAWGNNKAIEPALASNDPPEFVLLLNPDTTVR